MKKIKFFIDFHKEEQWLVKMAAQGWQLKKQGPVYTFESAAPEQPTIKIDYRHFKKQADFIEYRSLFEDSGWQHISGTKHSGNQYFKRKGAYDDDIFSDTASRAGRYKRLADMMLSIFILFLPIVFISISKGTLGIDYLLNPKTLYFTPGLWEMSGAKFWGRFLFETPFALMRGFSWSISLALIILYVLMTIKSWLLYRKAMNDDDV
ncbi:MAG: DUF2812 domain-containing protein [Lachnospiraceae bacterium]|jgi:hypothetical protein|nr:DUF2812 domain-containing protein [Lachnospiraceae bacterium]